MNHPIYPCFWFDNNANQAAEFYCAIFKGAITANNAIVTQMEICGKRIMLLNGGPMFKVNASISLFVNCESKEKTKELWDKLIEGGKAMMPMNKYPWSEQYGWLQDKYGITWQIMISREAISQTKITPSFLFAGKQFGHAEEAMKFYAGLFKNSAITNLQRYAKGDANEGKVLFAEFNLNGYPLIAMDGPGEHGFAFDEGVSFVITCDTQDEIDYYWKNLVANGGAESMCGWCKDRFGVSWQVVPAVLEKLMGDPAKSKRVVDAFMKMKKFDIEKLVNA